MSTVTFDTLKFVQTLESAGIDREQASALAAAVRDSHDAADLITKKDLEIALSPLRVMLGIILAGVGVILTKLFLG